MTMFKEEDSGICRCEKVARPHGQNANQTLRQLDIAPETRLHDLHPSEKFALANTLQRRQLTGSSAALKCISQTRLAIELLFGKFIPAPATLYSHTNSRTVFATTQSNIMPREIRSAFDDGRHCARDALVANIGRTCGLRSRGSPRRSGSKQRALWKSVNSGEKINKRDRKSVRFALRDIVSVKISKAHCLRMLSLLQFTRLWRVGQLSIFFFPPKHSNVTVLLVQCPPWEYFCGLKHRWFILEKYQFCAKLESRTVNGCWKMFEKCRRDCGNLFFKVTHSSVIICCRVFK